MKETTKVLEALNVLSEELGVVSLLFSSYGVAIKRGLGDKVVYDENNNMIVLGDEVIRDMSSEGLSALLLHEFFHAFFRHHYFVKELGYNEEVWNLAADAEVHSLMRAISPKLFNILMREMEERLGKDFITVEWINKRFGTSFSWESSAPEIYKELINILQNEMWRTSNVLEDMEVTQMEGGGGSDGGEKGLDELLDEVLGEDKSEEGDSDLEIVKEGLKENGPSARDLLNNVTERAMMLIQILKTAGKGSGGVERLLDFYRSGPRLRWNELLRAYLREAAGNRLRRTYQKPNRRAWEFTKSLGIILPYYTQRRFNIWVLLDTSGSISEEELKVFATEVFEMVKLGTVNIIPFDVEAYDVIIMKSITDFYKAKEVRGGGGTDPTKALKKAFKKAKSGDILIILTDGIWSEGEELERVLNTISRKFTLKVLVTNTNVPSTIRSRSDWVKVKIE